MWLEVAMEKFPAMTGGRIIQDVRCVSSNLPNWHAHEFQAHEILVLELCAGHAVLSGTAGSLGFRTLSFDSNFSRAPGIAFCIWIWLIPITLTPSSTTLP